MHSGGIACGSTTGLSQPFVLPLNRSSHCGSSGIEKRIWEQARADRPPAQDCDPEVRLAPVPVPTPAYKAEPYPRPMILPCEPADKLKLCWSFPAASVFATLHLLHP